MRRRPPAGNWSQRPRQRDKGEKMSVMLDMRKADWFRYDAKEVLEYSGMDERTWAPMLTTIIAKASRTSIREAKEYIDQKVDEKVLPPDAANELMRLLDRYKKWR